MWTNLDISKVIASMSENFSSYFEILMCAIYANTDDNMHMNRICRSGMTITLNSRISAHSTNWMNTWAPSLKGWASPLPEPENDINVTPQSNRFYKLWHREFLLAWCTDLSLWSSHLCQRISVRFSHACDIHLPAQSIIFTSTVYADRLWAQVHYCKNFWHIVATECEQICDVIFCNGWRICWNP